MCGTGASCFSRGLGCFSEGLLDLAGDALPEELADPLLLDELDDRELDPLLDDDLDLLPDELSDPLLRCITHIHMWLWNAGKCAVDSDLFSC